MYFSQTHTEKRHGNVENYDSSANFCVNRVSSLFNAMIDDTEKLPSSLEGNIELLGTAQFPDK